MTNWQKYWSYVARITVEKTSTKFNPSLIVAIQNGKYVLNANNANYSFASLHRVFQKALNKVDFKNNSPKNILALGLGAGSIPTIIYNEKKLTIPMDGVEIDSQVIAYGKQYFHLDQFNNLNIIIEDATDFVKQTSNKYDLILVDLFKGIEVPQEFLTQHFFEQLKSLLNPDGELLFNFVGHNFETKQVVKNTETMLKKVFPNFTKTYQFEQINFIFHLKN